MDAINYFNSMFTFGNLAQVNFSQSENRLGHALVSEARDFGRIGAAEMENGETVLNLAIDSDKRMLNPELARIALWHYQRAAESYRQSVDGLAQAAKIWYQLKRQTSVENEARRISKQAVKAEAAVSFLNECLAE